MELLIGIAASVIAAILCAIVVRVYQRMPLRRKANSYSSSRDQILSTVSSTEGKRVHKTFLFTDMVNSTDIRAACFTEFGDKGNERYDNEVLIPHDEILNRLILRFNGQVVSTAGDSYFVTFVYGRDAVQCAVAIQREFIEKKIPLPVPAGKPHLPPYLQIRIGLHTGAARELLRAGKPNYSDHTINIAARIEGLAKGEQVLMSQDTWSNAGRLKDVTKYEWKNYKLKGVDGVWTLVEALWEEKSPCPPQISPPVASATSFATIEAFDSFRGRVTTLTDELLSHPASPKRIRQFYAGAKLDWDIVAARADIHRDQDEEFLRHARQPNEGMRLVCIVAEAGAGKSTSAWRISAELHQRHKGLVIHIKDGNDPTVWYRMPEFCTKVGRPFYALVDDIFHDPDATAAFRELHPWLPITVIATSRPNEYRAPRLKCETLRLNLNPPSPDEKRRLLEKLGKSRSDLTNEQLSRLDTANQFLVLMIELTEGKELQQIVRDTLERLRELDESAYSAYEYLCFAYQHGIAMPVSLLEHLELGGRFYNLPERPTAEGLIFWDSRQGLVRAGHAIIAEVAVELYAQHHSPQAVLTEIATAVATTNGIERRFLAFLLRVLAKLNSPILTAMPESLENALSHCVQSADRIVELSIWRTFYRFRGQLDDAEKCAKLALSLEPVSVPDCNMLLKFYREIGREQDALPAIAKWVKDHPQEGGARVSLLGLIEDYGTVDDVKRALQETSEWLAAPQHADESYVRGRYLGLVERKGAAEQVAPLLSETVKWLGDHPDDIFVRTVYLGLVERKGRNKLKEQTIAETKAWLLDHASAKEVSDRFLAWLFRAGRDDEATELALKAISQSPNDQNLLQHYIRVVQQSADDRTVISLWERLINAQPTNLLPQVHYAAWLRDREYYRESEQRYRKLIHTPVNQTTRSLKMRSHYGFGVLLLTGV